MAKVVSIDYNVLDEEGNNILDLCMKYDDFVKKTTKILSDLKANWNSEAGTVYQDMLDGMIKTVTSDREKLEEFGKIIIKVRREFKENQDAFCQEFKTEFSEELNQIEGAVDYE